MRFAMLGRPLLSSRGLSTRCTEDSRHTVRNNGVSMDAHTGWKFQQLKQLRLHAQEQTVKRSLFAELRLGIDNFLNSKVSQESLIECWTETHLALEKLLQDSELEDAVPEAFKSLLEHSLDTLEDAFPDDSVEWSEIQSLLTKVNLLERKFSDLDLSSILDTLEKAQLEDELLVRAENLVDPKELTKGYYTKIVKKIGRARAESSEVDNLIHYLESQHEATLSRMEKYNQSAISPHEWTIRVALADRLMLEGYELSFNGLEQLCQCAESLELQGKAIDEALEDLLEANRCWILIEKFYQ